MVDNRSPTPCEAQVDMELQGVATRHELESKSGLADGIENESFWTRMGCTPDSFRQRIVTPGEDALNRTLKPRHLQMIAIGGSIGAGLFVGSGMALHNGGPAGLLLSFGFVGFMMFHTVNCLGELSILFPMCGGFYTYSNRFICPSWGNAMGWNYVFQWALVFPLELVVAAVTVTFWTQSVPLAVWVTIFLAVIILFQIFGVLGFAEEEFWASVLKLAGVVSFLILGVVCIFGGASGKFDHYWGARLWHNPGAFANGFHGVCSVLVTAAYSFSGTELVGLAAGESQNPAKDLPKAIKQVFWRIIISFLGSMTIIGFLVAYNDERLLGSHKMVDAAASPFVIVGADAGLPGYGNFMNTVILVSVLSIGNAGIYGGSRTLAALADHGYAPKRFAYIDRSGRPLFATIALLLCGAIGYVGASAGGDEVFEWLANMAALASLFTWGSICAAYIRFRTAWRHHGHTVDEIPFRAPLGVAGAWMGLCMTVLVFVAQFYIALYPLSSHGSRGTAKEFLKAMLGLPIVLAFFAYGLCWKRVVWLRLEDIDVDTGRRSVDLGAMRSERQMVAELGVWGRVGHFLF